MQRSKEGKLIAKKMIMCFLAFLRLLCIRFFYQIDFKIIWSLSKPDVGSAWGLLKPPHVTCKIGVRTCDS